MTLKTTKLRDAITFALAVGATAVAGTGIAFAQDATPPATTPHRPTSRPPTSTASRSPARASVASMPKTPAPSSPSTAPRSRRPASSPSATSCRNCRTSPAPRPTRPSTTAVVPVRRPIDLRGLGSQRTLVLINGRRVVHQGGTDGGADVNAIPASAVERIEVLTVGASSVYGSDAVAGVVNFIMRKDFEGMQASIDYGISDRQDGQRQGGSFTFGQVGEKGNIIAGVNYNKFDAISSGDRDFSKDATYLYGGVGVRARFQPQSARLHHPAGRQPDRIALRLHQRHPHPGRQRHDRMADYRCYSGAADAYNYQAVNLIQTPQERTNAFFLGNYQMTRRRQRVHRGLPQQDRVELRDRGAAVRRARRRRADLGGQLLQPVRRRLRRATRRHRRTSSAPASPRSASAPVSTTPPPTRWWRASKASSAIPGSGTSRSTTATSRQDNQTNGYVYYAGLRDALGPSFLDSRRRGQVRHAGQRHRRLHAAEHLQHRRSADRSRRCGSTTSRPIYSTTYVQKGFEANASGELFDLPAGAAQLAFGAHGASEYQRSEVDYVAIANPDGTCQISQEACGSPVTGGFTRRRALCRVVPAAAQGRAVREGAERDPRLRVTPTTATSATPSTASCRWNGVRSTTCCSAARSPKCSARRASPTCSPARPATRRRLQDPCVGYANDPAHRRSRAAAVRTGATNIPAGGIDRDTACAQIHGRGLGFGLRRLRPAARTGQVVRLGRGVRPELAARLLGRAWTTGACTSTTRSPTIGAQTVLNACYAEQRQPVLPVHQPLRRTARSTSSTSRRSTSAAWTRRAGTWRCATSCRTPRGARGNFGFDGTYIAQWDNDVDTDQRRRCGHAPRRPLQQVDYGNVLARPRAALFANWSLGDWSAGWRIRYVGAVRRGQRRRSARAPAPTACLHDPSPARRTSSATSSCTTAATWSTTSTWATRCRRSTRGSRSAWTT